MNSKIVHTREALESLSTNLNNFGINTDDFCVITKVDIALDSLLVIYDVNGMFNGVSYDEYAKTFEAKPCIVQSRMRTARSIIKFIMKDKELGDAVRLIQNIFGCNTKLAKKIISSGYFNDIRSGTIKRYLDQIPNTIKGRAVKVFISQPMSSVSEDTFNENRREVLNELRKFFPGIEFVPINPYNRPDAPKDASGLWFLGRAIQDMPSADIVVFADDWLGSAGCRVEKHICSDYHLQAIQVGFMRFHTAEDPGYDELYEKLKKIMRGEGKNV